MTRHKRNYSWLQECDVQIVYPAHILCKITVPQKDAKRKHIFSIKDKENNEIIIMSENRIKEAVQSSYQNARNNLEFLYMVLQVERRLHEFFQHFL